VGAIAKNKAKATARTAKMSNLLSIFLHPFKIDNFLEAKFAGKIAGTPALGQRVEIHFELRG